MSLFVLGVREDVELNAPYPDGPCPGQPPRPTVREAIRDLPRVEDYPALAAGEEGAALYNGRGRSPGEEGGPMVRFEGERELALAPAEAWGKLTDARFLVQCIPDVETVKDAQADRAELVLRPGFAFVRGTLEVTLQVVEAVSPTSARVLLHSKGIGSSSDVEATLALAEKEGGGTRVHWVAEVKSLGGLLKMVPSGLIRGAAQKVVGDVWTNIEAKLAAG